MSSDNDDGNPVLVRWERSSASLRARFLASDRPSPPDGENAQESPAQEVDSEPECPAGSRQVDAMEAFQMLASAGMKGVGQPPRPNCSMCERHGRACAFHWDAAAREARPIQPLRLCSCGQVLYTRFRYCSFCGKNYPAS